MENQTKTLTFNRLPILGNTKITFDEWKFSFDHWCQTYKVEDELEKIDYLLAITEKTARTIVYNSLNKINPENYQTIFLEKYYKKTSSKNSRILELSSITIKRDETITDFDIRFTDILNQVNKSDLSDVVITSYYINAFRNWNKIYENLMEEEPTTLEEAMKITGKKEKILNLMKENKGKEKQNNTETIDKHKNKSYGHNSKMMPNFINNDKLNNNPYKFKSFNFNIPNKNYFNNNRINNDQNKSNNYNKYDLKKTNDNDGTFKRKLINKEIEEITQKLSDLKINLCVDCMNMGQNEEKYPENQENEERLN